MNQVRMRIHKSRQHNAPAYIQLLRRFRLCAPLHLRARPSRNDLPAAYQHRAVFNQTNFGKGITPPRTASPQRNRL
jgi:hypothetical protein